jgi:hypothetical protein
MDWDKTINTVSEVGRKTFTLALVAIIVITSVTGTYIAVIACWWLAHRVREALGT